MTKSKFKPHMIMFFWHSRLYLLIGHPKVKLLSLLFYCKGVLITIHKWVRRNNLNCEEWLMDSSPKALLDHTVHCALSCVWQRMELPCWRIYHTHLIFPCGGIFFFCTPCIKQILHWYATWGHCVTVDTIVEIFDNSGTCHIQFFDYWGIELAKMKQQVMLPL